MTPMLLRWAPAALFLVGAGLVTGLVAPQQDIPLQAPLASVIPDRYEGFQGVDQGVSEAEAQVAGFSHYLLRTYAPPGAAEADWFSLYVGYYKSQMQGKTIHSPKNCLPGAGWEALSSQTQTLEVDQALGLLDFHVLIDQHVGQVLARVDPIRMFSAESDIDLPGFLELAGVPVGPGFKAVAQNRLSPRFKYRPGPVKPDLCFFGISTA